MPVSALALVRRNDAYAELLKKHNRIAIVGPPNAGKTTLSHYARDRSVFHIDKLPDVPRGSQVKRFMIQLASCDRFIAEGCAVVSCLELGLEVDVVVWLNEPLIKPGQNQAEFGDELAARFHQWELGADVEVVDL